ncbi:MAG: hypothetical protein AB9Q17_02365 [Candidatus Reddybacter sp.]
MPKKLQAANGPAGAHPDAAPDNTIQRNTIAIGKLVFTVNEHKTAMADMAKEISQQMAAMAEHRKIIDAHFAETRRSADTVAELVEEMRALNLAIPALIDAIGQHVPALTKNTEAINDFRL